MELWLRAAGLCQPRRPERKLGSVPTVLPGQHRMADQQDVSERQLRRHIHRLKEANYTANSGGAPGANLLKKFRQHDAPDDERSAVYHHQWGGALRMASARLQRHLKTKHDMAIQNWKERRKSAALAVGLNKIILLLGLSRTREVLSLVIAPMFKNSKIFGKVSLVKILLIFPPFGIYMKWISQWPIGLLNCPLFTINCAQILTGARKVAKKAGGPERLSGKMIALLPQEAHIRAAEMLNLFERRGMWPQQLIHWKVVFLPKKRSEAAASLGDTRPICIGPSLYRLWTSLRLEQLKSWLASYLDKFQAGGVGGPDVPSLLLTLNLDKHPEAFPVGLCLCLDYAKAFDSSDIDLIINIYIYSIG